MRSHPSLAAYNQTPSIEDPMSPGGGQPLQMVLGSGGDIEHARPSRKGKGRNRNVQSFWAGNEDDNGPNQASHSGGH